MAAALGTIKPTAMMFQSGWDCGSRSCRRRAAVVPVRQQQRRRRQHTAVLPVAATATALATREASSSLPLVKLDRKLERAQQAVLDALAGVEGRGKGGLGPRQQAQFEAAVAVLEADGGVRRPTASPLLEGRWRLLFTTRPGTASPIQRTFTAVESFSVYQDIELERGGGKGGPRVSQVVDFGASVGYLRVEAEASTDRQPLPGFTPRQGKGLPFGILGVSSAEPPAKCDMRIDFQFDRAAFTFKSLPCKIPYPVPFSLLGDERKGWIDVTYLSPDGSLRLSRGNKGTLFVLQKDVPLKQRLLEALARRRGRDDGEIQQLAAEMQAGEGGVVAPAASPLLDGTWRLIWMQQGETANWLQKALADQANSFQIVRPNGRLENLVCLGPGVRVRTGAAFTPEPGNMRTAVDIDEVVLELGPLKLPLSVKADGRGFVEWLYLDEDFRISKGNTGSMFIHTRGAPAPESSPKTT